MRHYIGFLLVGILATSASQAAEITTTLYSTDKNHTTLGTVSFNDTAYGLLITPHLTGVPAGLHGFHLHQHADCNHKGMAAGEHFDPKSTHTHLGPYGEGHLGDLPVLYVDANGEANTLLLAPRLKTNDIKGLSVMLHAGGDNYSDTPPLGGGGERWACGVIK